MNHWVEDAILYQGQPFQEVMLPLIGSRWAELATIDEVARAVAMKSLARWLG